jgi:hypothetical protein
MGKPQRRLTRDLEAEAVQLVETSRRTQKEIATDLGVVNDHGNGTPDFHRKGPLVWMCSNDSDRPGGAGWGCAAGAIAGR